LAKYNMDARLRWAGVHNNNNFIERRQLKVKGAAAEERLQTLGDDVLRQRQA